jgi:hypothetical protein
MVCKTDSIWLCHNKRYAKLTGSSYAKVYGIKHYVSQRGYDYVITKRYVKQTEALAMS